MRKIEQERVAARVCYGGGSRVAAGVCCGGGSRQERCCCTQEELPHDLFFKIFGGEAIRYIYIPGDKNSTESDFLVISKIFTSVFSM